MRAKESKRTKWRECMITSAIHQDLAVKLYEWVWECIRGMTSCSRWGVEASWRRNSLAQGRQDTGRCRHDAGNARRHHRTRIGSQLSAGLYRAHRVSTSDHLQRNGCNAHTTVECEPWTVWGCDAGAVLWIVNYYTDRRGLWCGSGQGDPEGRGRGRRRLDGVAMLRNQY